MEEQYRQTWEAYVATWRAVGREAKLSQYAACLDPACVYTDPLTRTEGWDALAEYMVAFHGQIPGGHFVTRYFLAHHGCSIARWDMCDGDGKRLDGGISYGVYAEDGKLLSMTGFFEAPGS